MTMGTVPFVISVYITPYICFVRADYVNFYEMGNFS